VLGGRKYSLALLGLLVVAGLVAGWLFALRPPRPSLPYPQGQSLQSVRGNCRDGNELLGCDTGGGPRSFLTVRASGPPRRNVEQLFVELVSHGWQKQTAGGTAHDFSGGGAPEDLQPLYCKPLKGCVGLFRFVSTGYVLAWFQDN
jgi:hypothetical protein